ncbi:MAG TPA: DUF1549 and DUF1553 domain-containing protein [Gemmataceae bacterium]|nr:DUF1549 and DUF1553 domain-containing protein [Gemmataceae bacterium]
MHRAARFLGCAAAVLFAAAARADGPPSFVNDVVPVFTRYGCNQGACHGKGAGQNGFRLTLRGYAPELDYQYLTREFSARRICTDDPEESLLLRKPSGLASHEGGKIFAVGSRPYQVLLNWIRAGTPGPIKDEPVAVQLQIQPGDRTAKPDDEIPLTVQATFSDGSSRDVTWLTKFASNDPGTADVDAAGKIRILRNGETSIRAAYQTLVAVVDVAVPYDQVVDPARLAGRNNFIDDLVFAKLGALRIEPSDLCTDAEFLRRASLDAIGVLPTPDEVRAFLADARPDKRARLIDCLLDRPEYVDYWTVQLADLLQNRKERDHDVRGAKGVRSFHEWIREQVAANRPWDELAREVLTAKGAVTESPAVGYYIVNVGEEREGARSEVVGAVAQAFLGVRIGCAKCHNHPLERYTQDDFYHFAGYFSRIHLDRKEPGKGVTVLSVAGSDGKPSKEQAGVVQPRTGQFLKPQPLDRSLVAVGPDEDPRVKLAAWITDPSNEYFSGAMVNRLWKHYLGVGLVEPVDDLRASNPPSNPALWRALNQEFVSHHYDMKYLMRLILNSRTYQLASATRPSNEKEAKFYSHYYARRLPAEVLMDALTQSTGVPDEFPGYPVGVRAQQLADPTMKSYFLTIFGRSERVTACACERNGDVTLPQLLHLENGDDVVHKMASADGRLAKLLKSGKPEAEIVAELSLATLSKPPTEAGKAAVHQALSEKGANPEEVYRDFFWALLNSKEFSFNH